MVRVVECLAEGERCQPRHVARTIPGVVGGGPKLGAVADRVDRPTRVREGDMQEPKPEDAEGAADGPCERDLSGE